MKNMFFNKYKNCMIVPLATFDNGVFGLVDATGAADTSGFFRAARLSAEEPL